MNGPEEKDQRTEMKGQGMQFEFEDARMQEFEQELTRVLQRTEVPGPITAKLLAVADEAQKRHEHAGGSLRLLKFSNSSRFPAMSRAWTSAWMGGAIAAVLAMGCFVGAHVHEQHERRIEAQRQFDTAERITQQTLAQTREELARQGIELEQ